MSILSVFILAAHIVLLSVLCLFGLHRLSMVVRWYRYRGITPSINLRFAQRPKVTVQIPLYNERFVAERVVNACAALEYPQDKLQIQIVDDSTDDTQKLVAERVAYYRERGINIEQVRRDNRQGFKAGALREASKQASGEFIAIFDADFIPPPRILLDTIDYFCDAKLGMVQFRWEHLNRLSSRFTQTQAMMLDAHFVLEQQVRYASHRLFNFNGTAGIWRAETIIDAGNWSADTLTEDLDLSYRAQLRGWKMLYLNSVACPGEIPADMNAFKSQQHRWAKGGIQVMKKMLMKVWRAPCRFTTKIESSFHLINNLAYLVVLTDTLLFLIPSIWIRESYQLNQFMWLDIPLLAMASGGHLVYLYYGQVALGRSKLTALLHLPLLMLLGIQLAFNNARAGIEALLGQQSEFVRTPKSGERDSSRVLRSRAHSQRYDVKLPRSEVIEFLVAMVYVVVLVWAVNHEKWFLLPFLILLIVGFMSTALLTLRNQFGVKSSS